jgi:hypothetical protein
LIDKDAWGAIAILDIHSNGASVGQNAMEIATREGLLLQSEHGFSIAQATIARTAGSAEGFVAVRVAGTGSNMALTLVNTRDTATQHDFRGIDVIVTGSSNIIRLTDPRAMDEALVLSGHDNVVELATNGSVCDVGQRNIIEANSLMRRTPCGPGALSRELELR